MKLIRVLIESRGESWVPPIDYASAYRYSLKKIYIIIIVVAGYQFLPAVNLVTP